jgi:AcrR family transcriptional regulator
MSEPVDRRTRKRLATRQAISDVATQLFHERGFDQVTVDEIAEAADVGRMTVFNHFPRKEDMFFDLDEEALGDILGALDQRDPGESPVEALRRFAHRAIEEQKPYVQFLPESQRFVEVLEASEVLKARARAIRDEVAKVLGAALAEAGGRAPNDMGAQLAANVLVTVWGVALVEAHRTYRRTQDQEEAQRVFLEIVDMGSVGLKAMLVGTPYA